MPRNESKHISREELDVFIKKATLTLEEKMKELTELKSGLEEKVKEKTEGLEESRAALMNILEDVEEARRRAEEERNKTLAIIANLTDGILLFDKENNLSFFNPQAALFFEIGRQKIIGSHILKLTEIPKLNLLINFLKKTDGVTDEAIRPIYRKKLDISENLILEATTIPIIRERERLGALIVLHDITREKLVERMKTEFVSLAAHQLRTPLSAIKWSLRTLLDGDFGEIAPEQRDLLEKTYMTNERIIFLINDLLNVTRIEEGRFLSGFTSISIEDEIRSVINLYEKEIQKRKLKLELQMPKKKLPKIIGDAEKIKLVVQNLIDNAIKYNKPGGKLTISLRPANMNIELKIQDTGTGIPKDQQNRIFTKFFRGTNVVKLETEGSGLGLFIVKNIVEAHGGKIWFESEEGKGTTFYLMLPLKTEFEEFLTGF